MEKEEEKLDPFCTVGAIFKMKLTDWGRVEQFVKTELYQAELVYVTKTHKSRKLRIVNEGEENAERYGPPR